MWNPCECVMCPTRTLYVSVLNHLKWLSFKLEALSSSFVAVSNTYTPFDHANHILKDTSINDQDSPFIFSIVGFRMDLYL